SLARTHAEAGFPRRSHNDNVPDYGTGLQTFPNSVSAGPFAFKSFGFFQADDADRAVPQVSFGNMPPAASPGSLPPVAGPGGPPGPGSAGPPPPSYTSPRPAPVGLKPRAPP